MDKYNTNTTFNKLFSPINLTSLSKSVQKEMAQFNKYVKKMDFEAFLKLLLHTIHDEKESLRHLENTVINPKLQHEVGLSSMLKDLIGKKYFIDVKGVGNGETKESIFEK